jgi:selenocysteine lyase/cysteine desulfurase
LKEATEFKKKIGENKIKEHNLGLSHYGQKFLAEKFKTKCLIENEKNVGAMFCVQLPKSEASKISSLEDNLASKENIYVKILEFSGSFYLRCCCQIINNKEQFETLASAVLKYI